MMPDGTGRENRMVVRFRGYTTLFDKLIPLLKIEDFSEKEIDQLLVLNPAEAFTVRVRRLK